MEIHVYDTYVKAKDGHTMHFDVFTAVKDNQKAIEYAKQWLLRSGKAMRPLPVENAVSAIARARRLTLPTQSTRMDITSTRWKAAVNHLLGSRSK